MLAIVLKLPAMNASLTSFTVTVSSTLIIQLLQLEEYYGAYSNSNKNYKNVSCQSAMNNLEVYECSAYWTKKTSQKQKRQAIGDLSKFLNRSLICIYNRVTESMGKRLYNFKY